MINITERGRSMIEMLGVLAVIGVLSVGGFDLVTKMNSNRKASAVIDEIGSLALKVRRVAREYAYEPDDGSAAHDGYSSLGAFVNNARAYPAELRWSDGAFIGTDGVTYTVTANTGASFSIQAANLTTDMCMQVLTTNWGNIGTSGFTGMTIGDQTASQPMTIGGATAACTTESGGVQDSFTITLTFK